MKRTWLRFWSDTLRCVKIGESYHPYLRPIAEMILPCHPDWYWQYRRDHNPANDNGGKS